MGREWLDLEMPCPGENCKGSKERRIKWCHAKCGRGAEISKYARIRCSYCNVEFDALDCRFACSEHDAEDYYQKTNLNCMRATISAMVLIRDDYREILADLILNLCDQEKRKRG
jgi:hypothetical protein